MLREEPGSKGEGVACAGRTMRVAMAVEPTSTGLPPPRSRVSALAQLGAGGQLHEEEACGPIGSLPAWLGPILGDVGS